MRYFFLLLTCFLIVIAGGVTAQTTIYVNNGGNDANQGTRAQPVKTLYRAKQIINNRYQSKPYGEQYEILLAGGQTFTDFQPQTNQLLIDFDAPRSTFAFVWDIDRKLRLSTYGDNEKATLIGNDYARDGGPSNCIAVVEPSTQQVEIRNLRIQRFQVGAIFIHETRNVIVRDNEVSEIGTLYFPDETDDDIYCAGVIYPRNSTNITVRDNRVRNCHNQRNKKQELHGLYMTRLANSSVFNNVMANVSGSALKIRRLNKDFPNGNNLDIYNNRFYHTGISQQTPGNSLVQRGWLRLSGDPDKDNCAAAITIRDNKFYYPFCDSEVDDCNGNLTIERISISNSNCISEKRRILSYWPQRNDDRTSWDRPAYLANPVTTLQAEARNRQSGTDVDNNHSGYRGSGFVDFGGANTFIEWQRVNGEGGGRRRLTIRYANGSSGPRSSRIIVNGQFAGSDNFGPTGGWDQWSEVSFFADLPHGDNTIRIAVNAGSQGPNVDQLTISDEGVAAPAAVSSPLQPTSNLNASPIRVYPNPARDQLTVAGKATHTVVLYDLNGREVLRHAQLTGTTSLDVSTLPAGLYVVRVSTREGEVLQQRVVIE